MGLNTLLFIAGHAKAGMPQAPKRLKCLKHLGDYQMLLWDLAITVGETTLEEMSISKTTKNKLGDIGNTCSLEILFGFWD